MSAAEEQIGCPAALDPELWLWVESWVVLLALMNGEGLDISESSQKLIQTGRCHVTEGPVQMTRASSEARAQQ